MPVAICETLGRIFSDLSENSLRNNCIPPIRNTGKMVIAITIIPIPPNHCKMARHRIRHLGSSSKLLRVENPVVVKADTDSKSALTNVQFGDSQYIGNPEKKLQITQDKKVNKKASRIPSFIWFF